MGDASEDAVRPTRIEHDVDEIWEEGRLEQSYNFLDYLFEEGGATCRARAYTDEMHKVTLFGPFDDTSGERTVAAGFERDVLLFLHRRFEVVVRR